jgi:hypothetical protein
MTTMSVVVSLPKVAQEIDALMEGFTAFLNRQTGELYAVSDDDLESLDEETDDDDSPGWEIEFRDKAREIRDSGDWVELPSKFDIHEWGIMEEFSLSIGDSQVREELLNAIRGSGAFRYFRDAIHRHGIQDSWYAFKKAAIATIAAEWLDEHGIAYHRNDAAPPVS